MGEQFAFFRWHSLMWPGHGGCERHQICWRLWEAEERSPHACEHGVPHLFFEGAWENNCLRCERELDEGATALI